LQGVAIYEINQVLKRLEDVFPYPHIIDGSVANIVIMGSYSHMDEDPGMCQSMLIGHLD
jgi:hypothetical protein